MAVKHLIYSVLLATLVLINIIFYRQFFIEQWMRYQLSDEYIIVALSTTPYRINSIAPTLDTLLQQNAKIQHIYLSVPYIFKRDNLEYKIPNWLLNNPHITILRTTDYGPATKLLGVLEKVQLPPDAIIVTVDDDVLYPKNLVLQLAYKAQQHPNSAVGVLGAYYDPNAELGLTKTSQADALVDILQGYTGVAYRRKFFKTDIFDITKSPTACVNSDDIYISYYLAKNNIPRQVLRNNYINPCKINWHTDIGTDNNSLHMLPVKPAAKHLACMTYLQKNYPHVDF